MKFNKESLDRRILFLVIGFQVLLFGSYYSREVAWYPPQDFDQAAYLTDTYRLEEQVLNSGPGKFWEAIWSDRHPSGVALPILGAAMGLIVGGTRLPQLWVNLIAFIALQLFAFSTARKVWSRSIGYALLGLILCQTTPWFWAGGLFDFRMDFSAYCLYGIWSCSVIRSQLFLDRRGAIGSALIGAVLVLLRFLTIGYLLGVCAGFAAVCLAVGLLWRADIDLRRRMWQRLSHLGLFASILILILAPILIRHWKEIYDYYVLNSALGQVRYVRANEVGIHDLAGHLLFYPRSIVFDHLGSVFLWASVIAIAGGSVAWFLTRRCVSEPASQQKERLPLQIIFLLGAILGPVLVLTADFVKSPVVGGIVSAPVALLFVAALTCHAPWNGKSEPALAQKLIWACSAAIFALGLFNQFSHYVQHSPKFPQRRDLQRLAELDVWLTNYSAKHDWHSPIIFSDLISGWFSPPAITASGYEQTGQLFEFRGVFGGDIIMGVSRQEALSALAKSDFLILTTQEKAGVYAFYQAEAQYWNDLKAWADKNTIVVRSVPFDNFTATIYARPSATVSDLSGGWITSAGLSLEIERVALQQFPKIRLSGPANYAWLPKIPDVSAVIDTNGSSQSVPASFRRVDNSYEILIDTSSIELPPSENVHLHLKFNTFFIPKEIGMNGDTRELVVWAPTIVEPMR